MIDSQCDCIQLMMKTIFKIILIILVSTSTVDSQLKRRRNGNLAPVYAHSERQRDKRSEGGSAVKSFIIKLSDNANHSDFEHLFEVLHGYNASLSFIEHSCRWEGVTAGMVAPLNASTLHWVRENHTHTLKITPFAHCLAPFLFHEYRSEVWRWLSTWSKTRS